MTVEDYVAAHFSQCAPAIDAAYKNMQSHPYSHKATPLPQVRFLQSLCRLIQARRVIEVGCFLGLTSLALADVLPADGHVIACERNVEWLHQAKQYWQAANLAHRIDACAGDARETLQTMIHAGHRCTIDLIYVDAGKQHYLNYLELGLQLLSVQGVMVFDNVLKVHNASVCQLDNPTVKALDRFNRTIAERPDLHVSVLPMYDGVCLVQPRAY